MPNIVASFEGSAPGPHLVLNGHTDVFPVGDEAWQHDPWSGADRRRQDLGARRERHEVRHQLLDLDLHLPPPHARPAQGPADAHGRLGRGDVRAVGHAVPDGASRRRGARRLLPERRAVRSGDDPLRRAGPAVARDHGEDARRTRRLRPPHGQREPHRRADRHRPGEAGGDRGADLARADAADGSRARRDRPHAGRRRRRHHQPRHGQRRAHGSGSQGQHDPERVPARDRYPSATRRRARPGLREVEAIVARHPEATRRGDQPHRRLLVRPARAPWSGSCRTTSST